MLGPKHFRSSIVLEQLEPRRLLAADLIGDVGGIYPADSKTLHGETYFAANDMRHGRELFKSNGTLAGTELVRDITPGKADSDIQNLQIANGKLLFFVIIGTTQTLWVSDGTKHSTFPLRTFRDIPGNPAITAVVGSDSNQRLLVVAPNKKGAARTMWSTDGSRAGTIHIMEFDRPAQNTDEIRFPQFQAHFLVINGRAIINVFDHVYSSDGTVAGTIDLTNALEIGTGDTAEDFFPVSTGVVVGIREFSLETLWRTDGMLAGTQRLKTISATIGSGHVANGKLFMTIGTSLWVSDGTASGTKSLVTLPSNFFLFGTLGGSAVFKGTDAIHGDELWISDGTSAGTHFVKDITPGEKGTTFGNFIEVRSLNFFEILDDQTGLDQLWRTDGTTKGTALVTDLQSDIEKNHFPIEIVKRNDKLAVLHFRSQTTHKSYASLVFDPDTLDVASGPKSNSIFLVNGTLRIFGTLKNDDIRVSRSPADPSSLVATLNGKSKTFSATEVQRIYVYSFSGNDNIALDDRHGKLKIGSHIWAGNGSDTITTGSARDAVYGENGNDVLSTGDGDDRVFGGAGDDVINAGAGDDIINGEDGADSIVGGDGNDIISDGHDYTPDRLDGGADADIIFAQAASEIFSGGKPGNDPTGLDEILLT